ncbi:MAG: stage II sporulation protein M [Prevotella sp.]|nr:stage II sporulation protein M [Prevotella sp.]
MFIRDLLSKRKIFVMCFAVSILIWSIPFCLRIIYSKEATFYTELVTVSDAESVTEILFDKIQQKQFFDVFIMIFTNNLKGCLLNIGGGTLFSVITFINLCFNGYLMADTFVKSYYAGFKLENIIKTTLPHSFELVGFWISGAIGFMMTMKILSMMRGKIFYEDNFYIHMSVYAVLAIGIIFLAALVETYVSMRINI